MNSIALIVAGGEGSRMGSTLPKQFLLLCGRPLMMYTMEAFYFSKTRPEILLVMHGDHLERWKETCQEYSFTLPHTLVSGGKNRSESVLKGLEHIENTKDRENFPSYIAIHDAVRPLVSRGFLDSCFDFAIKNGNCLPGIPLRDSIRIIQNNVNKAMNREDFRLVQTPQIFRFNEILEAYKVNKFKHFSDDASLMESMGHTIHLINGEEGNIKITFPIDLYLAEILLKEKEKNSI